MSLKSQSHVLVALSYIKIMNGKASICRLKEMIPPPLYLKPPHFPPKHLLFFSTSSRFPGLSHNLSLTLDSQRTLTPPEPNKSSYPSPLFFQACFSPPFDRARVMSCVDRRCSLVIEMSNLITLLVRQEPEI